MQPDMVCTWWLDGVPQRLGGTGREWLHCCIAHDLVPKSRAADAALGACVRAVEARVFDLIDIAWPMGWIMQFGVNTLGTVFVIVTGLIAALRARRKTT